MLFRCADVRAVIKPATRARQQPSRGVLGQVGNPSRELFNAVPYYLATEIFLQHFVKAAGDTPAEQPGAAQGREYKPRHRSAPVIRTWREGELVALALRAGEKLSIAEILHPTIA